MKIETPKNKNYCAVIVRLPEARFTLEGLDNLEGVNIFGYQVLVSKGSPSTLGIFFPAETQLSDKYCYENNLYRHNNLNKLRDKAGYLEDNRRIKAVKFKGNMSSGLFMPLDSLKWTNVNIDLLKEGDEFDSLSGNEICRKYEVYSKTSKQQEKLDRGFVRTDKKYIPEHIDTENFFRNSHLINSEKRVVITQKLHGTSIRVGNTIVNRKLSIVEKVARFFGAKIQDTEYSYLYGSRKVIKDANNPYQKHFYDSDIWSLEGKKLDGILPKNYIVYGELIGWTPDGKPIQKGYTYGIPKGKCELYIYRITNINPDGFTTDLHWKQVKEFCEKNGLKYVPQLGIYWMHELIDNDFKIIKDLMNVRYLESGIRNAVWLGENNLVDEGVCIRSEGITPTILKAKSPLFLEHETKVLDTGEEDLESSQNHE